MEFQNGYAGQKTILESAPWFFVLTFPKFEDAVFQEFLILEGIESLKPSQLNSVNLTVGLLLQKTIKKDSKSAQKAWK